MPCCVVLRRAAQAAPEVLASGQAGRASDVFSFAVLAFEVISGIRPYTWVLMSRGDGRHVVGIM